MPKKRPNVTSPDTDALTASNGTSGILFVERAKFAEFRPKGEKHATEVHLIIYIQGVAKPLLIPFISPEMADRFMSTLAWHRNNVWPDAGPPDLTKLDAPPPPTETEPKKKG